MEITKEGNRNQIRCIEFLSHARAVAVDRQGPTHTYTQMRHGSDLAVAINSGRIYICVEQSEKIFPSHLIRVRTKERGNRKLGAPAKTARLKATVRELLGFLRRKAPLAEGQPWKGEGLIAPTRFPYAKPLYGGRHEISEGPITAPGGAPSSRISGINSTLCDIQICAVEFFSLTRFYPTPSSPSQLAEPLDLSFPSRCAKPRARSIIENCGM